MFLLIYMNQCHLAENKVLSALKSDLCLLLGQSLLFFFLTQQHMLLISYYHNTSVQYLSFLQYTKFFSSFNVAITVQHHFLFYSCFNREKKKL